MEKKYNQQSVKKMPMQKCDYRITLKLQLFMTLVTAVFVIASFLNRTFFVWLEFLLGLDLFVLAVNNVNYYKRSFMTWVYIGVGVAMILVSIMKWCGAM